MISKLVWVGSSWRNFGSMGPVTDTTTFVPPTESWAEPSTLVKSDVETWEVVMDGDGRVELSANSEFSGSDAMRIGANWCETAMRFSEFRRCEFEMDLQDELLRDWDDSDVEAGGGALSSGSEEVENDIKSEPQLPQTEKNETPSTDSPSPNPELHDSLEDSVRRLLAQRRQHDIQTKSITTEVPIFGLLPQLRELLERFRGGSTDYMELLNSIEKPEANEEYQFVLAVNDLATIINDEIRFLHSFVKHHYKLVFPELDSLVASAIDYAKTVIVLKQDLALVRGHRDELAAFLSNEKILLLTMAAVQNGDHFRLSDFDIGQVLDGCVMMVELHSFLDDSRAYIALRVQKMCPNLATLVGSVTASQLLVATGSLRQLAATPACNLASLGVREYSDADDNTAKGVVRQTGYLFHCDLVRFLPLEVVKQAMRIVSGKVVLAARIDLARTSPDGTVGASYRQELHEKIDKLLTPPENRGDKALPAPVDQKLKKRGGRRFRKMKERFQMSELRRAQNRMEFGKAEDTVVDSFGNEVGLGMSAREKIGVNENTGARMSKRMAERLGGDDKRQKR